MISFSKAALIWMYDTQFELQIYKMKPNVTPQYHQKNQPWFNGIILDFNHIKQGLSASSRREGKYITIRGISVATYYL